MNRLIRKKHERIQASIDKYESAHGYRQPEPEESDNNKLSTIMAAEEIETLTDRELLMHIYGMLAAQQEQIDRITEILESIADD